jgi:hypothetical protein
VNLLRVRLAQRPAEDPEVVRVGEDGAPVHLPPAGDHAVGVGLSLLDAEADGAVPAQLLDLGEGVLVEEQGQALVHGELALGFLLPGGPLVRA